MLAALVGPRCREAGQCGGRERAAWSRDSGPREHRADTTAGDPSRALAQGSEEGVRGGAAGTAPGTSWGVEVSLILGVWHKPALPVTWRGLSECQSLVSAALSVDASASLYSRGRFQML